MPGVEIKPLGISGQKTAAFMGQQFHIECCPQSFFERYFHTVAHSAVKKDTSGTVGQTQHEDGTGRHIAALEFDGKHLSDIPQLFGEGKFDRTVVFVQHDTAAPDFLAADGHDLCGL